MDRSEFQKNWFFGVTGDQEFIGEETRLPKAGERWRQFDGVIVSILGYCHDDQSFDREIVYRPEVGGGPSVSQPLGRFLGLVPSGPHKGVRRFTPLVDEKSDDRSTDDIVNEMVSSIER